MMEWLISHPPMLPLLFLIFSLTGIGFLFLTLRKKFKMLYFK